VTELPDTAYALTSESTSEPPSDIWVSDTGATSHICNNRKCFTTFRAENFNVRTYGRQNATPALGRGTIKLVSSDIGRSHIVTLEDTIYCPEADQNLLSISKLDRMGGTATYGKGRVTHYTANRSVLTIGALQDRLYHLNLRPHWKLGETAHLATHK